MPTPVQDEQHTVPTSGLVYGFTGGLAYITIANNLNGSDTDVEVTVYETGGAFKPPITVPYGTVRNLPPTATYYFAITGAGANVTVYASTDGYVELNVVSIPAGVTATVNGTVATNTVETGGTPVPGGAVSAAPAVNSTVVSNNGVTGSAGTGDTGVGVGVTDTLLFSLSNPSASKRVFILPSFLGRYSGATGSGSVQVTLKKLLTTGTAQWPITSFYLAVVTATTYNFAFTSEGAVVGGQTELAVLVQLPNAVVLYPGETLYAYGTSGVSGSVAINADYISEVL